MMDGVEAHSCGVRLAAKWKMDLGDTNMIIIYLNNLESWFYNDMNISYKIKHVMFGNGNSDVP